MKFMPNSEQRQAHEYWLTWTITIIVGLELMIALLGFWEGKEQLAALRDQDRRLTMLNQNLQASIEQQKTSIEQQKAVNDVLGKQLAIFQEQEDSRLAALRRKPRLVILSGGADLMNHTQVPSPCLPLPGRGDVAGCFINIQNRGDAPLTHGHLRAWETTGAGYVTMTTNGLPSTQYLSGLGLHGNNGIEIALPTLVKGEPPRSIEIDIVLNKKQPIDLNLQLVGDETGVINLKPLKAAPAAK